MRALVVVCGVVLMVAGFYAKDATASVMGLLTAYLATVFWGKS